MPTHLQVTEEQLARLFGTCGRVVDCRICGDPRSTMRFAFVEFDVEQSAKDSLRLSERTLGYSVIKVGVRKSMHPSIID